MVRSEFSSQIKDRTGLRGMNARERDEGRGERCESGRGRKKRGEAGKERRLLHRAWLQLS